ncbi:hypothetical protein UFOVP1309_60 [uncultured Caudovirales phage]|uniref:Uncharacterized protein n=1 Tax=uncultured Caudovirales phage TaxID=2100421 RepID=A0A6J5RV95_9CAUD|nr:hypothetical protein UFOVP1309_60 [uncultured Caudovirales phage]
MRKKCRRKHYPLVNPIDTAIDGARISNPDLIEKVRDIERQMIQAIVGNTSNGLFAYKGLCEVLGVAETMARNGIGPEVLPACEAAQMSLIKLKTRFEKWGKWDITPTELHTLNELIEWHDLQRQSISRGEYEKFLKNATNRMRSRAPKVIEV